MVTLTADALHPESLKRSIEMKARAYLREDKLGEIVPFLECMLEESYLPGWSLLVKKLEEYFTSRGEVPGKGPRESSGRSLIKNFCLQKVSRIIEDTA